MGRPTDTPKPYRVYARLDAERKEILDAYTKQENVTAMDAVRRAIKKTAGQPEKRKEAAVLTKDTRHPVSI